MLHSIFCAARLAEQQRHRARQQEVTAREGPLRGPHRGVPAAGELCQREGARGYRVTAEGEEPLEARLL